jgi:hypothetical protein
MAATTDATPLDDRDVRALTRRMSVLDDVGRVKDASMLYLVVSESGSEYLVDLYQESCECPDARYRDVRCQHIRRVEFHTGERKIPAWADRSAIDPFLLGAVAGGECDD